MGINRSSKLEVPKILFIHNTIMWYTSPFFMRLNRIYDMKFVFNDIQLRKDVYGVDIPERIEGFEGLNYKVLKNYFGIAFGVIKELLKADCNVIVDSLGSIEALFSFTIAKLRGKPIIFWSEEWGWKRRKSWRGKLVSLLISFIVSHSNAMLVPGTKHKEYLVSLGVLPDKIFIMPNTSNFIIRGEDYENKERLREKLDIGTKKVVLYTGRLVKRKGVKYLITAFAKLRQERDGIVLIIAGKGECSSELKLLAKALNIENSVYFLGFVNNVNLLPYYLLCDICTIPSITCGMGDPWVFVVNEAMHCGKPIIATDAVGAAFDMIKDGENGYIIPEKDSDALYQTMKKVFSDLELAKKMGEKSKRIIEEGFRYEHMIASFKKAIKYVSGGNSQDGQG